MGNTPGHRHKCDVGRGGCRLSLEARHHVNGQALTFSSSEFQDLHDCALTVRGQGQRCHFWIENHWLS